MGERPENASDQAMQLGFIALMAPPRAILVGAIHGLEDLKAGFMIIKAPVVQVKALTPGKRSVAHGHHLHNQQVHR
jgi:hypothetical protein